MPSNAIQNMSEALFGTLTQLLLKHKILTADKAPFPPLTVLEKIKELHSPRKEQAITAIEFMKFVGNKILAKKLTEEDAISALKGVRAIHLHIIAKQEYGVDLTTVLQDANSKVFNSLYFKRTVVDLGLGEYQKNEAGEPLFDKPLILKKNIDYSEMKKQISFIAALVMKDCYVAGEVRKGLKLVHSFSAIPELDVNKFIDDKRDLLNNILTYETALGAKATAETIEKERQRLENEARLKAEEEAKNNPSPKVQSWGEYLGSFWYSASSSTSTLEKNKQNDEKTTDTPETSDAPGI